MVGTTRAIGKRSISSALYGSLGEDEKENRTRRQYFALLLSCISWLRNPTHILHS